MQLAVHIEIGTQVMERLADGKLLHWNVAGIEPGGASS